MIADITCIIEPSEGRGGLYQGAITAAQNVALLADLKIKAVLSCLVEQTITLPPEITVLRLECHDYPNFDMTPLFPQSFQFLDKHRFDSNVLVHCHLGKSRSSCIVLAYLMKKRKMTLQNALAYLKAQRPSASPNPGFIAQLLNYEKELFGTIFSVLNSQHTPFYTVQMSQIQPAGLVGGMLQQQPSTQAQQAQQLNFLQQYPQYQQGMSINKPVSAWPSGAVGYQPTMLASIGNAPTPTTMPVATPSPNPNAIPTQPMNNPPRGPMVDFCAYPIPSPVKPAQQVQYSTPIVKPGKEMFFPNAPEFSLQSGQKLQRATNSFKQLEPPKTFPVPVSNDIVPAIKKAG